MFLLLVQCPQKEEGWDSTYMGDLVLRDQEMIPVRHWVLLFEEVFTL